MVLWLVSFICCHSTTSLGFRWPKFHCTYLVPICVLDEAGHSSWDSKVNQWDVWLGIEPHNERDEINIGPQNPNESYLQHLFWISPVFGSFYSKISRFPKRMAICPPVLPTKPPGVPPVFNGPFPQVGSEERRAAGDPWTGTLSEHVAGTPAEMGSPSQSVHWWGCWQCTLWSFNSSPWKITMLLIGKPSISMAIYTMAMLNNQRVIDLPMIIII